MFLNPWSIALTVVSLLALALALVAARTGVRVLRFWDPFSDSALQIELESETWLASTLISYALVFQIFTLVLFSLAADSFSKVIVGAMCATGALLGNAYGIPALLTKIAGVFLYGFWIVVHRLDIKSAEYPLVRVKFILLLVLLPLLFLDFVLQTLYIAGLSPDIITSCCAVVFAGTDRQNSGNLIGSAPAVALLGSFYGGAVLLAAAGSTLWRRWSVGLGTFHATAWLGYLAVAFLTLVTLMSSYIYAMPYHNCPFCMLKSEYCFVGYAIYGTLMLAGFFGTTPALVEPFGSRGGLREEVRRYQAKSLMLSTAMLVLFIVLSSWHYVRYLLAGGEI